VSTVAPDIKTGVSLTTKKPAVKKNKEGGFLESTTSQQAVEI
jgi:hypothetical protein